MYLTYKGPFQYARVRYFRKIFSTYASQPGAKVLDFGCGPGDTLLVCKELGVDAVGVDAFDYSIKIAAERGLSVIKADHTNLPFEKNSFDVIFLQSVLEHLRDPVETIEALKAYLKPTGALILSSPTPGPHFWDDPTHVRPFTIQSFRTLAQWAGLKLELNTYVLSYLLGLNIQTSLVYKLLNILPFSLGSNIIGVFRKA